MCTGYQFDFQELRGKEHYTVNFQSLSIRSNIHCHKYIRGLYLNCDLTVQANNMQTTNNFNLHQDNFVHHN